MSLFTRIPVLAAVAAPLLLLAAPAAHAQQPGQGPPLPAALDLKKVAPGSWAEYSMTVGQMPPMKSRMALVARTGSVVTMEMTMEGGMMAMSGGKLVMQTVVDADQTKESNVKKLVMQIGDNDPMEMKVEGTQPKQFQKPDPKTLVKEETIKTPAGTFKTKHYRDKTPKGEKFDYWVSPQVPPFGLVRVETENLSGGGGPQGPVKMELTAYGKDAKMTITKPPKPMDQQALMRQIMGGAGGPGNPHAAPPGGAGGPANPHAAPPGGPPAPAPAPAPGK
jgi:hypothetical protein